jgi:hypothetical protein
LLKQALMTPAELGMLAEAMWLTAATEPTATSATSNSLDGTRRDRRLTMYKVGSSSSHGQDEPLTGNVKDAVRPLYTTLHMRISLLIS